MIARMRHCSAWPWRRFECVPSHGATRLSQSRLARAPSRASPSQSPLILLRSGDSGPPSCSSLRLLSEFPARRESGFRLCADGRLLCSPAPEPRWPSPDSGLTNCTVCTGLLVRRTIPARAYSFHGGTRRSRSSNSREGPRKFSRRSAPHGRTPRSPSLILTIPTRRPQALGVVVAAQLCSSKFWLRPGSDEA